VVPRIAIFFPPKKNYPAHIYHRNVGLLSCFFQKKKRTCLYRTSVLRRLRPTLSPCRPLRSSSLRPHDVTQSLLHRAYPSAHGSKANGNGTAVRDSILSSPSTTRTSQPVRTEVRGRIHPARTQNPDMVETVPNPPIGSIYLSRFLAGCSSRRLSDAYEYGSKLTYVITPSTN
jgi:hypothetical protein